MLAILYESVHLILEVSIRFPQFIDEENDGWGEKGIYPRWNCNSSICPMVMKHKARMGATCMILNFSVAMFSYKLKQSGEINFYNVFI